MAIGNMGLKLSWELGDVGPRAIIPGSGWDYSEEVKAPVPGLLTFKAEVLNLASVMVS